MNGPMLKRVTLIGTGVIGRGWIQVFSRAGCETRIYDPDARMADSAMKWVEDDLIRDKADGFIDADEIKSRLDLISVHDDLEDALDSAEYIQESGPENIRIKQSIFSQADRISDPSAIIASSSSALDINQIAEGLKGISRCILAHPYNPPHVIPAVEVLPTKKASPGVIKRAMDFLNSVGQVAILMNFHVDGFLGNRIQSAVVREAIHLVERGVASVEAVDAVVCHGLGLRWALFGNFGVNNTNADGGIREYYKKYGEGYKADMNDLDSAPPPFDQEMIERIAKGVDDMEGGASVAELCRWRDRMIRKIRRLKEEDPHPKVRTS
jgi:L-gulonate 3-dehydrogenase